MSGASGRVSTLAVVSRAGLPVYTADFAAAPRDEAAHLHEFVMHAALDAVQEQLWSTPACYLRVVDGFRDLLVSAYVTSTYALPFLRRNAAQSALRRPLGHPGLFSHGSAALPHLTRGGVAGRWPALSPSHLCAHGILTRAIHL